MAVPDHSGGSVRWSLDHLFLDADGVPTFVEVKRASDTRIRREVVGQMLDYAANGLAYWPASLLREAAERTHDDAAALAEKLQPLLAEAGAQDDVDGYFQRVAANLAAGRARLVFVADEVPIELQRVVEFLNGQLRMAEVLAVEVRRYRHNDGYLLAPRLVGATAAAENAKGPRPLSQTVEQILAGATDNGRRLFEKLKEWAQRVGLEISSAGRTIRLTKGGATVATFDTRTYGGDSTHLILWMAQLQGGEGAQQAGDILRRLRELFGAGVTPTMPNLPGGPLLDNWREVLPVLEGFVSAIANLGRHALTTEDNMSGQTEG